MKNYWLEKIKSRPDIVNAILEWQRDGTSDSRKFIDFYLTALSNVFASTAYPMSGKAWLEHVADVLFIEFWDVIYDYTEDKNTLAYFTEVAYAVIERIEEENNLS